MSGDGTNIEEATAGTSQVTVAADVLSVKKCPLESKSTMVSRADDTMYRALTSELTKADVDSAWVSDTAVEFSTVTDIAPSPAGGVFVLDSKELTVTGMTTLGRVVRKLGSRGDGPGEFSRPYTLGLHADSLWVTDTRALRITLFALGSNGGVSTRAPYVAAGAKRPFQPMGIMVDGSVIVTPPGREGALGDPLKDTIFKIDGGKWSAVGATTRVVSWQFPGKYGFLQRPLQPFVFWDGFTIARDGSASLAVETSAARLIDEGRFIVSRQDFLDHTSWKIEVPYSPTRLGKSSIDSVAHRMTKGFPEQFAAARDSLFKPRTMSPVRGIIAGRFGAVWIGRNDLAETAGNQ